ncbi:MAG: Ribonuclease toxin YhaV [Chlamydiales bacterium]|nr:Ribonuclease toxin YhaV [Chlamydiales bacterium]
MEKKSKYLLKFHKFYFEKTDALKAEVKKLKKSLDSEAFAQHPDVKFAARLRDAAFHTIPKDPNRKDYQLHGDLKKYRRYKQGLQRYRLFFTFSSKPPVILYLYINDKNSLRKEGDKNDPYKIFAKLVNQGKVSHDPNDLAIQKWVRGNN